MWIKRTISDQVLELHRQMAGLRIELANLEKKLRALQSVCPHPGGSVLVLTDIHGTRDCKTCGECGKDLEGSD